MNGKRVLLFSFLLRVVFFSVVSVNLPENPEEYALKHLNRSARFARCARSIAALADGMLFFPVASCCLLWFPRSSQKSMKNLPTSFQNHPQNHPESTREPPKIRTKTLSKRDLEWIALRIAFVALFSSDLAASWALSRASGDQLGAVLGRLGASWSRPGTASRRS